MRSARTHTRGHISSSIQKRLPGSAEKPFKSLTSGWESEISPAEAKRSSSLINNFFRARNRFTVDYVANLVTIHVLGKKQIGMQLHTSNNDRTVTTGSQNEKPLFPTRSWIQMSIAAVFMSQKLSPSNCDPVRGFLENIWHFVCLSSHFMTFKSTLGRQGKFYVTTGLTTKTDRQEGNLQYWNTAVDWHLEWERECPWTDEKKADDPTDKWAKVKIGQFTEGKPNPREAYEEMLKFISNLKSPMEVTWYLITPVRLQN